MKLTGDAEYSVAGRSIVIHENADDLGKDIDTKYYKQLGGGPYKGGSTPAYCLYCIMQLCSPRICPLM